jgi:AcrR family transcriptional regulator
MHLLFSLLSHNYFEMTFMAAIQVRNTRDMLIEVARQLFAKTGVDNTTMNDIAHASKRGRRTLYTYFRNKNEVYLAVIESELNKLYESLSPVLQSDQQADKKLAAYIYARLDAIKNAVHRNGTLRALFFRDIRKVEKVRKKFDQRDIEIIRTILETGLTEHIFNIPNPTITASILHHALKGLEVPYIKGIIGEGMSLEGDIINLIFDGIRINSTN